MATLRQEVFELGVRAILELGQACPSVKGQSLEERRAELLRALEAGVAPPEWEARSRLRMTLAGIGPEPVVTPMPSQDSPAPTKA